MINLDNRYSATLALPGKASALAAAVSLNAAVLWAVVHSIHGFGW